jgi:hypothetical protein
MSACSGFVCEDAVLRKLFPNLSKCPMVKLMVAPIAFCWLLAIVIGFCEMIVGLRVIE